MKYIVALIVLYVLYKVVFTKKEVDTKKPPVRHTYVPIVEPDQPQTDVVYTAPPMAD